MPDERDAALELTRRNWWCTELSGAGYVHAMWAWDRFSRRMLLATARIDVLVTSASQDPPPLWRGPTDTDYQWMLPWSLTGAPGGRRTTGRRRPDRHRRIAVQVGGAAAELGGPRWPVPPKQSLGARLMERQGGTARNMGRPGESCSSPPGRIPTSPVAVRASPQDER